MFLGGSGWHRGGGGYDFPRGRACSPDQPSGTQWDPGVAESMSRWSFPGKLMGKISRNTRPGKQTNIAIEAMAQLK